MFDSREKRLLQDKAYAAYRRLNQAIKTADEAERRELLEEHKTMTDYALEGLKRVWSARGIEESR